MKYLKIFETYRHNSQDKRDDMRFIYEFSKKFEDLFEFRLNIDKSGQPEFRSYLGYGYNVHYFGQVVLDNPKILKRKVKISYNIFLTTDINPNGVTDADDIDRTFTIDFEINNNKSRNVNRVKGFRSYSRNIDDILESFDNYLIDVLDIGYLTDKEIEERKFKKTINKYNI